MLERMKQKSPYHMGLPLRFYKCGRNCPGTRPIYIEAPSTPSRVVNPASGGGALCSGHDIIAVDCPDYHTSTSSLPLQHLRFTITYGVAAQGFLFPF